MRDDVDAIMAIMVAAFDPQWGEAWTRSQIESALVLPTTHYRISITEGEHSGFTLVRAAPGEEELLLVGVMPHYRGRGLGYQLLEQAAQDARSRGAENLFLEMRENNTAASLYQKLGFEVIGRRKAYYKAKNQQPIDAITYALRL